MEKREFIGIDVSKGTIDAWLYKRGLHRKFKNRTQGFQELINWAERNAKVKIDQMAICFEHTGLYSLPLSIYLHTRHACFFVVSGLLIKRSLGLQRGKSDKVDAQQISRFVYLHFDELRPYEMPSQTLIRLKQLCSLRARMVKQSGGYKAYLREIKAVLGADLNDTMVRINAEMIKSLDKHISEIEMEIKQLILSDSNISTTYHNVTSIKGVGLIVASAMIVSTNNFKTFDTWRKFACYAGIAPFEHSSGISYRGKIRISHLGNRKLKTLLSLAATSSIQWNPEMKIYYLRKLADGKNKMSILNVIRNKIVSRIFAVAKRGTPYVDVSKYAS